MNEVSPDSWHTIKMSLCEALYKKKVERTLEIMKETYADADVIFLQEAAAVFIEQMGATDLSERYHIFSPEKIDAKRDQNSLVLASKVRAAVAHTSKSMKTRAPNFYMNPQFEGQVQRRLLRMHRERHRAAAR
mmetsp:Transcript_11685/g.20491  ORF Transcript_11685/g.20491 Transcript_11685/m.20491 type:complete len:133 (-) Transcript_11685:316-714(-)